MTIRPGRYEHYKGRFYQVLDVARHSETEEELVVYRTCYGDHSLWVRPLEMFISDVETDDGPKPRFRYVGSD